ncbi:hypothetical protein SS50377_23444 [Spironucleus salmonicida]|uniref:Transmembrane protein n=1 Tax=Spironucleus salmonicida TaxID=348837 RepID=V6LR71_9EUKA|nr:hypothetical protein SS50377_23444 [Spironucleus salmonicida]|eukprot:EST46181.1 Hypothetical protein SS50377_13776 [Spironucleus salmonicida]
MILALSCWYPLISVTIQDGQFTITASGYCPINKAGQVTEIQVEYQSETTFNTVMQLVQNQKVYIFDCRDVDGMTVEQCKSMMKKWKWYPIISLSAIMKVPHTEIEGVNFTVETGPCFAFVIGPTFWIIISIFSILILIRCVFCTFYLRQYWTALYQREISEQPKKPLEVKQIDQ